MRVSKHEKLSVLKSLLLWLSVVCIVTSTWLFWGEYLKDQMMFSGKYSRDIKANLHKTQAYIILPPVNDVPLYLHSATIQYNVIPKSKTNINEQNLPFNILVTMWQVFSGTKYASLQCCVLMKDLSVKKLAVKIIKPRSTAEKYDTIRCVVYFCPFGTEDISATSIEGVSVADIQSENCPSDVAMYVEPFNALTKQENGIAVCPKIVYGKANAGVLVEWMEHVRLMGASKVILFVTEDLNDAALRVIRYYEELGLVEASFFDIPEKVAEVSDDVRNDNSALEIGILYLKPFALKSTGDTVQNHNVVDVCYGNKRDLERFPRRQQDKTITVWNDENVILRYCQGRMLTYKYGLILDIDEFLLPNVSDFHNSWMKTADRLFTQYPHYAGLSFRSKIHLLSWAQSTSSNHSLYIERQLNSTLAFNDRKKTIMKTENVFLIANTHTIIPKKGFKRPFMVPEEDFVVHHYRSCRWNWELSLKRKNNQASILFEHAPGRDTCEDFKRVANPHVALLADQIRERVTVVKNKLGIHT